MLPASRPEAPTDDDRLVARLRGGNDTAFDAIVARHRPWLLAYARRVLGRRDDVAEDMVQEALWRAHRGLLRDERPVVLRAWLTTLVRNCCLDELARRRLQTVDLDHPAARLSLARGEDDPSEVHERSTRMADMLSGIATLPAPQRHALVRREVDGASHREIAVELGITVSASRALIHRARANLTKSRLAADARCETIRDDLLQAHRTARRASVHTHRHLLGCRACRAYRAQLRTLRRALHLMHPGPAVILASLAVKAGLVAKLTGSGGASGALVKAPGGALAATLAATAVGGTLLLGPGDPSPTAIRSPVLPQGRLAAGEPLPPGTAVVARLAEPGSVVTLACPSGMRVADLLPPDDVAITVGYREDTVVGSSRTATVVLGPAAGRTSVGVALLCRRPSAGSLLPRAQAWASATPAVAAGCRAHAYLRRAPGGAIVGSVRLGQQLRVLRRDGAWLAVRTQLDRTGWLPARAVCRR